MDDLINRQAAIDALRKMQTYKLFSGDDMLLIDQAGAQTELMLLPPAQPEPHWIPVTERLPKKCNTTYLATVDYGEHGMAVGQRFFFDDNIGWNDKSVVAWMPLPEPYKGVTE